MSFVDNEQPSTAKWNSLFPLYGFSTLSSTFNSVANATEQTVTGLSTTISNPGYNTNADVSCVLNINSAPAGNNNFRLYINGSKVNEVYCGAVAATPGVTLEGYAQVSSGSNITATVTVQNDASNSISVNGTASRSAMKVKATAR